jgi:hypothetical protein
MFTARVRYWRWVVLVAVAAGSVLTAGGCRGNDRQIEEHQRVLESEED